MKTYERLGIVFDNYSWESDYKADSIVHILKLLDSSGLMATDKEGRSIVKVGGKEVPVLKSDGTTLYLTRDIAAAIDRYCNPNETVGLWSCSSQTKCEFIILLQER